MKIPDALYRCHRDRCGAVCRPSMLRWWDGQTYRDAQGIPPTIDTIPGWYCSGCIDALDAVAGLTLADHLDAREKRDEETLNKVLDGPEFVPTIDEGEWKDHLP